MNLLRVQAAGRPWGVPIDAVERVGRPDEVRLDLLAEPPRLYADEDDDGLPLVVLNTWSETPVPLVRAGQRLLWLRHDDTAFGLLVDAIDGQPRPTDRVDELPALPFRQPPPIRGLAHQGAEILPLLDLDRLLDSSLDSTTGDDTPLPITDIADPGLMLLPTWPNRGSDDAIVPAISRAQALGVDAASDLVTLPGLPTWCLGVGWWRQRPLPVVDPRRWWATRHGEPVADHPPASRWLTTALPGGGGVLLAIDGPCRVAPLPAEITEETLPDSLADGLLGLFRDGTTRLALLDLERWIRPA